MFQLILPRKLREYDEYLSNRYDQEKLKKRFCSYWSTLTLTRHEIGCIDHCCQATIGIQRLAKAQEVIQNFLKNNKDAISQCNVD